MDNYALEVVLFLLAFSLMNYSFLKLILYFIRYYNALIIIHEDKIVIIRSSLIMMDDIEIINSRKITKVDKFAR